MTEEDPEVAWDPVQPPEAVQEEALVELQESVEEPPLVTEVGEAERVRVGAETTACVVALAEDDCAEVFPAASYAETVYVYAVAGERPVSVYVVAAVVPTCVPFRYTLYPVTPTLSVEAVQERFTWLAEAGVAERPEGTEGGVVSGGGVVPVDRAESGYPFAFALPFASMT